MENPFFLSGLWAESSVVVGEKLVGHQAGGIDPIPRSRFTSQMYHHLHRNWALTNPKKSVYKPDASPSPSKLLVPQKTIGRNGP
eukprot:scaffold10085_cov155-Cylindrotheca_fusiformis.AAC.3